MPNWKRTKPPCTRSKGRLNWGPLSCVQAPAILFLADIVAKVFLRCRTKILRTADAFYVQRREGTISFRPKLITDLRSGVEKRRSSREAQRSTSARFFGLFDFRLLQQYRHLADVAHLPNVRFAQQLPFQNRSFRELTLGTGANSRLAERDYSPLATPAADTAARSFQAAHAVCRRIFFDLSVHISGT